MAEAFNTLYKSELINHQGPWLEVDDIENAALGYMTGSTTDACTARSPRTTATQPSNYEALYYRQTHSPEQRPPTTPSRHETPSSSTKTCGHCPLTFMVGHSTLTWPNLSSFGCHKSTAVPSASASTPA